MSLLKQVWQFLRSLWGRFKSWFTAEQESASSNEASSVWSLTDVMQLARNPEAIATTTHCNAMTLSPLDTGDSRFIGREKELASLLDALTAWRSGRPAMVVVSGPQGCGITSLVNQWQQHVEPNEIIKQECLSRRFLNDQDVFALIARLFDLQESPEDFTALIDLLNQAPARILFIDDAHYLASRLYGERDAVRGLGAIMVATQGRHLWVLGCRHHAWRRLIYTHQADRFFSHSIALSYFDQANLSKLINARLIATKSEQTELPPAMLQRLVSLSMGKPDLVLLYLLQTPLPEASLLRPLDTAIFKRLEMEDLFTLAELAVHGCLTLGEHQQIFRLSTQNSQLRLNQLCNWGLVEAGDETDQFAICFKIMPMVAAHLSAHLYKTNYLY